MDTNSLTGGYVRPESADDVRVIDFLSCEDGMLPIGKEIDAEDLLNDYLSKACETSIKEEEDDFQLQEELPKFKLELDLDRIIHILRDTPSSSTVGGTSRDSYVGYKNSVRPNRVTGSGFWKARSIDKPVYSSNVNTGTVNNWLPPYNSIFDSIYDQQQQFKVRSSLGPKYKYGYGYNSSYGETSTNCQHQCVPDVHIDILNGNDQLDTAKGNNGHIALINSQQWNELKNQLKNSKFDDGPMKMMSGTFAAVSGQVVAGMMVSRLTASASSWTGPIVELATVLGLCATLAGISLRGRSRQSSTLMIKIGAVTTAWAIIFSMGLHLPPVMAWTVGLVAFLIMAVAAAFA